MIKNIATAWRNPWLFSTQFHVLSIKIKKKKKKTKLCMLRPLQSNYISNRVYNNHSKTHSNKVILFTKVVQRAIASTINLNCSQLCNFILVLDRCLYRTLNITQVNLTRTLVKLIMLYFEKKKKNKRFLFQPTHLFNIISSHIQIKYNETI